MNLSNYFWHFSGVLTPKFCDDVIKYALSKEEVMARTGGYGDKKLNKDDVKNLYKKRKSDLVWLNDTWIYKELHPYVHMANKNAGWNFQWERSESCQFTKYKLNQYYDWHTDPWDKPYQRKEGDPDNALVVPSQIDAVLVESLMLKKLSGVSSFEHAVVLSDVTVQMMLGNR